VISTTIKIPAESDPEIDEHFQSGGGNIIEI
jgi:hypothetical protein